MKKNQRAFTLIELMTVVATIGILASLAIPAFQTYSVRAQVSEGLNLAGPVQAAIVAYNLDSGTFPADNADAALGTPTSYSGSYVESISVTGAVISIQYGNDASAQIAGETLTITATRFSGSIKWACATSGVIPAKYLPTVCR
jgi:type IV pilus assembly protein PilA